MDAILLIEDDAETREAMREWLSTGGYRVLASDESRKALELATVSRPSLVVLDLSTPGMNGWDFLARRGEDPVLSRVPVLVVTGSVREPPRDATAVLRKPVDPQDLLRSARELICSVFRL